MTEKEVRALMQTDPLPENWKGMQKVHEHVYHSIYGEQTQVAARRKLKRAKNQRKSKNGYYCPGGKHEGTYKRGGLWFAYLHFARYE